MLDHEPTLASKIILPVFELTEICNETDLNAQYREIISGNPSTGYYYRPVEDNFPSTKYRERYRWNQFPVVLNADGSPWEEACLFLLDLIESNHNPNMTTYSGKSYELVAFKQFVDKNEIDYFHFPKKKRERPTYAYRDHLQEKVDLGELSAATAKGQIGTVKQFYSWLIHEGMCNPEHAPWKSKGASIEYKDAKGFSHYKQIATSDLIIKGSTASNSIQAVMGGDGELQPVIQDGGKLRPLNQREQEALIDSLKELKNTQMMLIHFMALFTGARIQTILTMRVKHAQIEIDDDIKIIPFLVGPKVGIDTKNNKRFKIFIPTWLYQLLKVYSYSPEAEKRRKKSGQNDENQYLFLTRDGNPIYISKMDMMAFDPTDNKSYTAQGTTVRLFMLRRVIPLIRQKLGKPNWSYQFHDLRASFGMNQLDHQMRLVADGKSTLTEALRHVQGLMAHESLRTTEVYLKYRQELDQVRQLQNQHEGYLRDITERAMDGQYD